MKHNYYSLNIAQYAVFSFSVYNMNKFLAILCEPKYQLAIYKILHSNIKAYSSAHLLNTVLEILSVTFDTTFTSSLNLRRLFVIHQKLFNVKKYILKMFI